MKFIYIFLFGFISSIPLFAQDEFDEMFQPKTTVGGYGELHYNYSKAGDADPKEVLDFHRFVLYFSHAWTQKWSFRSELELEHNYVKDGQGELQLEQAFLNYQHALWLSFQGGVLLAATSLINEYHEPVFFFSVERPEYARYIIPSTWFGNGIGASGFYKGIDYRVVIMEGLDGSGIDPSSGIRDARQKGFKANAEGLLYNGRLDYVEIPGLRIGASFVKNNAVVDDSTKNQVNLWEFHARYQAHGIYSTFEYGNISYSTGDLKESQGFYFDLGYDAGRLIGCKKPLIPWVRWTDYNTAAVYSGSSDTEKMHHYKKWLAGLTWFPIDNVVLKLDYGERVRQSDKMKTKLFNLGFGYNFQ